ncbi:GGDEF domain-containing protein [Jiella mangrovi]|uniref:diguanylate cyclase n=1 Tax=Jiella mangrovi TaxID=2821407 RepID=A0ABS4BBY8_9HYPH|nr:GGDEF domain-containing protein [Jiella mangrovi]MBP0614262.1 GGDEF domain-containing protein [Jiella mangrovi]
MSRRWWNAIRGLDRATTSLLLATAALALFAVVTSLQIQRSQRQIVEVSHYDLAYVYTRTQIEVLRLQSAISDALLRGTSARAPKLRWAIVKSRVSTIPISFGPIDVPEAVVARRNLDRTLDTIEPLIATMTSKDALEAMQRLDRCVQEFTRLTAIANIRQTQIFAREQEVLSRAMFWLSANLLLLCLIGFALLTLIFQRKNHLRQAALTDVLTGLPNRAAIQIFRPSKGWPAAMALALVDVDRFKQVNDRLGHAAGDKLLRQLADTMRAQMGDTAFAARLGGDEFVLIFTGSDARQTAQGRCAAIERAFRRRVAATQFADVTLSIGIAEGAVACAADITALMNRADDAMYVSKRDGGDGQSLFAHGKRRDGAREECAPADDGSLVVGGHLAC